MAGDIENNGSNVNGGRELVVLPMDGPPDDDCCPICFGVFNIPCKTNCGHWYCANCILQYWNSRATMKQCKCPMCSRPIKKLTPEAALLLQREGEIVEALKKIQQYNRLYVGGLYGLLLKVFALPLYFKRVFQDLINPDSFGNNWQRMRIFAYLLGLMYNLCHFQILPTGSLRFKWAIVQTRIDLWLASVVVILYFVGLCRRWILRRRIRLLAAERPRDA